MISDLNEAAGITAGNHSGFEDLWTAYSGNKQLIHTVNHIFSLLDNPSNVSNYTLSVIYASLSDLIGEEAAQYILNVVRSGVQESVKDRSGELFSELIVLYTKYNTYLLCAEKFVVNPYAFVVTEFTRAYDFLKIVRADRKQLELEFDVESLATLTDNLLSNLHDLIEQTDVHVSDELKQKMAASFHNFVEVSGGIDESNEE